MANLKGSTQAYLRAERDVTRLVQLENERLTRLLRNLYQEFRLGRGDRSQLYEHVCRELAQYFHCDCCQLYLLKQERLSAHGKENETQEVLLLAAAFGPWKQAIQPQYVRRVLRTQYGLNSSSHTARRFREPDPTADICRRDYRADAKTKSSSVSEEKSVDVEWHLVWSRDNLYSVSRNILSCPVLRHRSKGRGEPYPIGLIKLENRRPFMSRAFESDWPTARLYLGPYFELCAVAAYIKDLQNRAAETDRMEGLFAPLHDADGWRQHFQEHSAGKPYFEEILKWQKEQQTYHASEDQPTNLATAKRDLQAQYTEAAKELSSIMDLTVEVEALLQELTIACRAIWKGTRTDEFRSDIARLPEGAPAPSLFNAVGLARSKQDTTWLQAAIRAAVRTKHPGSDPDQDPVASCKNLSNLIAHTETSLASGASASRTTLWQRLTRMFRESNKAWGGLLATENREAAAKLFCELIEAIAGSIQQSRKASSVSALTTAELAAYQCADEVSKRIRQDSGEGTDDVKRLAGISAAACMYAHTFDPRLDTTRLFSIQSHVSQVLDNYLMDKARLSGLGVSFDDVEILGLTESSIDELDHLHRLLRDTARCLVVAVRNGFISRRLVAIPSITPTVPELREILDALVKAVLSSDYRAIDLIEIHIRPPVELDRKAFPRVNEGLLRVFQQSHMLKVQLKMTKRSVYPSHSEGSGLLRNRPVPQWLFALNDALARFREDISGFERK